LKIKLLKKVRKRYSIVRVDEIGSKPTNWYLYNKTNFGIPFYVVKDRKSETGNMYQRYHSRDTASGNIKTAMQIIINYVIQDYTEKFRHKDKKETKIWHLNR
jgi:hypothetical protein